MYLRSFHFEKTKIGQRTFSKKELCEIGEKAIWESRFTSIFLNFEIGSFVENLKNNTHMYKNIHYAYCMFKLQISLGIMKTTNKIVDHIDLYKDCLSKIPM